MLTKKVWIITDKKRKVIATGVPRNRELRFIDGDFNRILTYTSKGRAAAGFKGSGFYSWGAVGDYLKKAYNYDYGTNITWQDFLEPVECTFSLNEVVNK